MRAQQKGRPQRALYSEAQSHPFRQPSEEPQLGILGGRGPLAPGQEQSCRKSSSVKPPRLVKYQSSRQASRFLETITRRNCCP